MVDPDAVDTWMAQELNSLSPQEREDIYEEVHVVRKDQEETPQFLEERLRLMQSHLDQVPDSKRGLYDEAATISSTAAELRPLHPLSDPGTASDRRFLMVHNLLEIQLLFPDA